MGDPVCHSALQSKIKLDCSIGEGPTEEDEAELPPSAVVAHAELDLDSS